MQSLARKAHGHEQFQRHLRTAPTSWRLFLQAHRRPYGFYGLLIWNDLSNVLGYLRVVSDSGHATAVTIERLLRRLITLIYAGRDRMVVIRRELPRTKALFR